MFGTSRTPTQQLSDAIAERLASGVDDDTELTDEQVERAALLLRPSGVSIPIQRAISHEVSRPYSAA
jgi:hypothetical protein